MKSEIGLEIKRSRAHHLIMCAKKLRNTLELHNFIYMSLQKVKQAVIEVLKQEKESNIKIRQQFDFCEVQ